MTKYTNYYKKETRSLSDKVLPHPVWRGIGLIFMIILPVMSFLIMSYVVKNLAAFPWLEIPKQIIFQNLWDPYIAVKLIGTILLTFVLFVVVSFFTFIINSLFGGNQ